MKDSIYVTPQQVADHFQVAKNTVRNWADAGFIQRYYLPTVGRNKQKTVRFLRSDMVLLARKQPWNNAEVLDA